MRCEHCLHGFPLSNINEVLDHAACSDWMETVLNFLNDDEGVRGSLLDLTDHSDDGGLASSKMKLRVLLVAIFSD
ncbi:hypothetical protein D3C84_956020 [compost metagenome]